jgi:hypothetical protein
VTSGRHSGITVGDNLKAPWVSLVLNIYFLWI